MTAPEKGAAGESAAGGATGRALLERAMGLHRDGRSDDAAVVYEAYLRLCPDDTEALFLAGSARLQDGDGAAAVSLLSRAAAMAPGMAPIHCNLGLALLALDRKDESLAACRRAVALDPGLAEAFSNLGSSLTALGRHAEAVDAFRDALRLSPDMPAAHNNLGMALRDGGDAKAAIASFRRAVVLAPGYGDAHTNLCYLLLERRAGASALAACNAYLAACPGHTRAIAFASIALRQACRETEAEALIDMPRLFRLDRPPPPPGYADLAAFNRDLAEHVLRHPSLRRDPSGKAVRLGWRTDGLAGEPAAPVVAFVGLVRHAAAAYVATVPEVAGHPFALHRPAPTARLDIWGTVMERGGHESPHCHPNGWLSGVYYPRVPPSIVAEDSRRQGWIGFGRPPELYPLPRPAAIRWVMPNEGLLILMPSYCYHETAPLAGDDVRVSVAFDVLPPRDS